ELVPPGPETDAATPPSAPPARPGRALARGREGPPPLRQQIGGGRPGACLVELRGGPRVWGRSERANAAPPAGGGLAAGAALGSAAVAEATALGLRVDGRILAVPGGVPNEPGGLVER
ncbi:hypothetical protein VM98_35625, partial [Streptomyces rubellomurinus subsp. indigoferus]